LRRLLREEVSGFAVVGFRDGTRLATVGDNGTFRLWHTDTWESTAWRDDAAQYSKVTDHETGLLFTAENRIRCRPHDGTAIRVVATLTDDDGDLSNLASSADGKYICAVTERNVLIVWDAATWRRIAMQRVEGSLSACVWTGHDLVAVGNRGVYRFTICE
jgi:WD40 repeat protein